MSIPDATDIIAATELVVAELHDLRSLLAQVNGSVLDKAPDGMSVAYLPADLLAEIRARLS